MPPNTTLDDIVQEIRQFSDERDWGQFHTPKNLSASISIESAELLELFQWDKSDEGWQTLHNDQKRQRVEEELSDVMIYALRFADLAGIDVLEAMQRKIAMNAKKYPVALNQGSIRKER